MKTCRRISGIIAATVLAISPVAASAQQVCVSDAEISAITIYSVPGLVQALQLRCGAELSPDGFLARDGGRLSARYGRLQTQVWPRAKSGLLKVLAAKSKEAPQELGMLAALPDDTVRPLLDALIVQEASPRIAIRDCNRIERMVEAASTIDPEIAGTLIGGLVSLVDPDELPICPLQRS